MAEPIYPRDYSKLKKVYSGNIPGKPRGLLPNEEPLSEFFYVHSIDRILPLTPAIFGVGSQAGFWTVQARQSQTTGSPILFEQSVLSSAVLLGGFGGLITGWFPAATSMKFKTRICDGEFVPVVVEAHEVGHGPPPTPPGGFPAIPGLVQPHDVKVTSMKLRMPPMPAGATSMQLLASTSRYGTYQVLRSGLEALQIVGPIDVVSELGVQSNNIGVAPTEMVWWKVRGVNGSGTTDGEAIRDTWSVPNFPGTDVVAGYRGFLYAAEEDATSYYEQYYEINTAAFGGSFQVRISGDLVMPAYRCSLPVGAYWDIISDYWVGQLSNNDLYYSISYKTAVTPGMSSVFDGPTGSLWSFVAENGSNVCARTTRPETYSRHDDYGTFGSEQSQFVKGFRYGATLVAVHGTRSQIRAEKSTDEGRTWAQEGDVIEGIKALASVRDRRGIIYVYGIANEGSISSETPEQLGYAPGDPVCVTIQETKDGLRVAQKLKVTAGPGTTLPIASVLDIHETNDGFLMLALSQDESSTNVFRSTDGCLTWTQQFPPAAAP